MIDCKATGNYLTERNRMCDMYVQRNCKGCVYHTTDGCWRTTMEHNNPEKAIEIVQKWSNGHPQKTLLTEFLKFYPNAELNSVGCPNITPCKLGLITIKDICKDKCIWLNDKDNCCKRCWNTPINEESVDEND